VAAQRRNAEWTRPTLATRPVRSGGFRGRIGAGRTAARHRTRTLAARVARRTPPLP